MKRVFYMIIGMLSLALGAVGCVLPILPTVPFLLVSSYCFLHSSEKLSAWFQKTKLYQKHLHRFKTQKGLTLKAKLYILIPVYIILISLFILKDILAMRIAIVVLLLLKTIVFIKIKTIKEIDRKNDQQEIDSAVRE